MIMASVYGSIIWDHTLCDIENIMKLSNDHNKSSKVSNLLQLDKDKTIDLLLKFIYFMEKMSGACIAGLRNYSSQYTAGICKENMIRLFCAVKYLKLIIDVV